MTGGEFIAWRTQSGLTQQEAALKLGVATSTVQRYEAGAIPISRHVAMACAYLELSRRLDRWIVGGTGEPIL